MITARNRPRAGGESWLALAIVQRGWLLKLGSASFSVKRDHDTSDMTRHSANLTLNTCSGRVNEMAMPPPHAPSANEPTFFPRGVSAATAARSISPVARWQRQCSFLMTGLCVPFPQPGGPAPRRRSRDTDATAPSPKSTRLHIRQGWQSGAETSDSLIRDGCVRLRWFTANLQILRRGPRTITELASPVQDSGSPMRMMRLCGLSAHSMRRCTSSSRSWTGTSVRSGVPPMVPPKL